MRYGHLVMSIFCAWVLWSHGYTVAPGTFEERWTVLAAYESKKECSTQAETKKEAIRIEAEKNEKKVFPDFRCLPDTVEPRASKAGK